MVPGSKKMDMLYVVAGTVETKNEFSCYWAKMVKECRPEGQDWQILRQVSPTQSHQSNGAAGKAVSPLRGLARTLTVVLKDKIPSFDVTTHSPMLPWTIRDAAWVLTRYNAGRGT